MNESTTPPAAPIWAIIELMGHARCAGIVSKDTQLGTPLLRVEVPQSDGSFVTQLVNPQSIYRLTMCSEEIGRAAASQNNPKPMHPWELKHLLPATTETDEEEDAGPFGN